MAVEKVGSVQAYGVKSGQVKWDRVMSGQSKVPGWPGKRFFQEAPGEAARPGVSPKSNRSGVAATGKKEF